MLRMKSPDLSCIMIMGIKARTVVAVALVIAQATWLVPLMAAAFGSSPSWTKRETFSVTTDANGYFGAALASGVTPGYFVTVQVITPVQTGTSTCLVSSAQNDTWPWALQLSGATPTTTLTARDFIDGPGRARWYKFDVLPGQRPGRSLVLNGAE